MDRTPLTEYLELADWRRQVAATWDAWRRAVRDGPRGRLRRVPRRQGRALPRSIHSRRCCPERRATFTGLPYWPYDPAWRMAVRLEPFDSRDGRAP